MMSKRSEDVKTFMRLKAARFYFFVAFFVLIFSLPLTSHAQDYSFSVPRNYSDVYVNYDGSITIRYQITFTCDFAAHPIDIVDIGLPNDSYDISSAKAWINSRPISEIYPSTYIGTGVEVHLGAGTIQPGQTGTLIFQIGNPRMVFTDDEKPDYASVEFSPTWYGSSFTHDATDLIVSFHFPKGVGPDETVYHYKQFDTWSYDDQGNIVFTWRDTNASPSKQYMFGVSFPKMYVGTVYEPYHEPLIYSFFKIIFGIILFFLNPVFLFFFFIFAMIFFSAYQNRRRKLKYFPPAVSIEGVGIKRGLKAPEAAMILELPLNKVITMVLFGLLKKGFVRVEGDEKPKVFKIEGKDKAGLSNYEVEFLKSLKPEGGIDKKKLRKAMVDMIKDVNKKIKGFSRRETKDYYKNIVELAWKHVETAKTPELIGKEWEDKLEWILMDQDYGPKMEETFGGRDIVLPRWWGNYYGGGHVTRTSKPIGGEMKGGMKVPGAEMANRMVTGMESFSGKFISNVESFISGVTRVTNPPPKGGGGSSRSGGGGCACACACAGCACACAGGGR